MRIIEIIQKKRYGRVLDDSEIRFVINQFCSEEMTDYQMSAFAMAICTQGMNNVETSALTDSMLRSGAIIDLSTLKKFTVDKHSTGGVGDKISLHLAPAIAACGVPVPMMSGRGLSHTGGTIDKLESIPGFKADLSIDEFRQQLASIGCCIVSQSNQIAPADKKLYALRDVTGTVESIPLIASSIMSKKLAEGVHGLVLDVKFGNGAFMKLERDAELLAETMVAIGSKMGTECVARITSMHQPIGKAIGNALELKEAIDMLDGHGPSDLMELTLELGAEMLLLSKTAKTMHEGRQMLISVLKNGKAKQKFIDIITAQGGDAKYINNPTLLPTAPKKIPFLASQTGYLSGIDAEGIGIACAMLGGNRQKTGDIIDHSVGIEMHARVADKVERGQPLCTMHVNVIDEQTAVQRLENCFSFSEEVILPPKLFGARITG